MLNIDKLKFGYNKENTIIDEINLAIKEQEFTAIIGPNGSGKSTLLKNISNLFTPDSGVVYLEGSDLLKIPNKELAQKMSVVPQETNIGFNFSVYDIVMMGRHPYQGRWGQIKDDDRKIVEEALTLTDTRNFRDRDFNSLSGGEKQRVIIARALAQDPEIILLDEPTSSLDINYQREIFDLLAYLNQERNLTILVVSHDLNLSGQYCSRLVLLHRGKIFASGEPEEVLTEDNIGQVYNTQVKVRKNYLTGRPYVVLMPGRAECVPEKLKTNLKIHLISGGGTGQQLIKEFYERNYQLSCGILNQGDSDWELARRLGYEVVDIKAFSYIEEQDLDQNKDKIAAADIVVVSDLPFGHGNVNNLKQLLDFTDKKILLLEERKIEERDYTRGEAERVWQKLIKKPEVEVFASKNNLLVAVENIAEENKVAEEDICD